MGLRRSGFSLAVLGVLVWAGPSLGQELRLDEQGQWRPVEVAGVEEPGVDEPPEVAEARDVLGRARALLADDNPDGAYRLVDDWLDVHERSDNPYVAEALVLRGDALTARGDEYKALYDYEQVIRDFAGTESFVAAVEREVEIGNRYINGLRRKVWGLRIDNARLLGEELLVRAQERLPGSALAERAALDLADHYYRERRLDLATDMYDIFVRNYPESAHREHAMERRIFSNIARFKGPRYDASGLVEASALMEEFRAEFPLEAERIGLTGALEARIDESAAAQRLESAHWYLRRNDLVAARITLEHLARDHRGTVAAGRAQEILVERGWAEPVEQAVVLPSVVPADTTPGPAVPAPGDAVPAAPVPPASDPPMEEMTPVEGPGR